MMKLWYSFTKELKLSSKSFYFYIEIGMAVVFLALLLLVIPDTFNSKSTEYVYFDIPKTTSEKMIKTLLDEDLDGKKEAVEIKSDGDKISVDLYETEDKKVYVTGSEDHAIQLAKTEKKLGSVVRSDNNEVVFDYYLQGYESDKLKNMYKAMHNKDSQQMMSVFETQEVRYLSKGLTELSDRENLLPAFLTFNGSLMGLFMIMAFIFLDKGEGIVTAYSVTTAPLWMYLLSKTAMVTVTATITSLIITIPIMGLQPNYLMMILFLITSGFFVTAIGLVVTSYYKNMLQAFGAIYMIVVVMLLPNIAYYMPGWNPTWIKFIPSYYFLQSFKEALLGGWDMMYIVMTSLSFVVLGAIIFMFGNYRFKKTLTL